ncbi:unnamed protein product [Rotaria magnacalcarata]|uniref:Pre-mRNA-splicing factor 38 n=7 Tax=Rotaria magnacalcarata TaxID=392030 RepID=A0A819N961_9BILA|nr:unnamed protein product [Rotaria magnacalcarata]CAF1919003.1 unnamed protein product [Rotaria magnacalcarata]CAF2038913.1 unnamed protein product [Rotaria magnacalcarata]CAF2057678.1 unnamed protein product [Rotaria magnacalcarata]CAF3991035.1 unnamed protein product [Rotaria magnacalcarata]
MAKDSNILGTWGNKDSMNLNSLVLNNIMSSQYFKSALYEKKTYHEVVDEIYYRVKHLEPWEKGSRKTSGLTGMCGGVRGVGGGGIVSTAYCLLYKLYTLKLTRKQVISLTIHTDSPFIRALGFMYIRYTQPPNELFEWFEEYLDDPETLDVKAGGGGVMSIGQMLRQWLTRIEWYDTLFPRIPVPVQKEIMERLHAHGPYKGDSYGENSRYDYEDEQYESKSSNAIDMPETFGNAASSSKDRNGTYNQHYSSSSDSHRDKKYSRSSRDDRERSRSSDRRRHHERYDNSDRYKSHKHHHHRRSSSREDQRRHHHRSRSPDDRYRNDKRGRP